MLRVLSISLAISLLLSACPAPQSSRCKQLCQRQKELDCIETLERSNVVIDENECTATCTVLERHSAGRALVDDYAECAARAADCQALLQCQ